MKPVMLQFDDSDDSLVFVRKVTDLSTLLGTKTVTGTVVSIINKVHEEQFPKETEEVGDNTNQGSVA